MTYTNKTTGRFNIASWKEAAYVDIDGKGTTMGDAYYPERGLTHAQVFNLIGLPIVLYLLYRVRRTGRIESAITQSPDHSIAK